MKDRIDEVFHKLGPKYTGGARDVQHRALTELLSYDSPLRMVEAPTGTGKSALAMAYARLTDTPFTVIVTGTISLQDQYCNDFPSIVRLQGKSNFRCTRYPSLTPGTSPCVYTGETCDSPFYTQEESFYAAEEVITNYAYYLSSLKYSARWKDRRPDLLVLDEGHRLIDWLCNLETAEIHWPTAARYFKDIPRIRTVDEARTWAVSEWPKYQQRVRMAIMNFDKRVPTMLTVKAWLASLVQAGENLLVTKGDKEWFRAVPVWPMESALSLVRSSSRILFMSATLWGGKFFTKLLGMPEDIGYTTVESTFPKESWPIYYRPIAWLTKRRNVGTVEWDAIGAACHELMHNTTEKGVIHVASFEQVESVAFNIRRCEQCRKRLIMQRIAETRAAAIKQYRTTPGTWIIHPSLGEGESFDDDLCRVNIIAKIGFPNLQDPLVQARLAAPDGLGVEHYYSITCASIAQAVGRGMRSDTDRCDNYILDKSFGGLYDRNRDKFPAWFQRQLTTKGGGR